jgi:RNA polymerase sigma factor (sigma-70 family)
VGKTEAAGEIRAVSPIEEQGDNAVLGRPNEAARKRAAVETYSRYEEALRRTARRYSLCADDADDALQRGLEILLTKAPTDNPRELIRWTQTVVKHEALAVRRDRERILSGPAAVKPEPGREDWVALLPADADGPLELAERREAIARSREALQALKPQELRALGLLAEGYSYAEIGEITGFSRTKVNRCLAEGRERFRKLLSRSEDGSRCEEMGSLLSAFCDGESSAEEAATLREHLRACTSCRATLRAYRAAPRAVAALAPALPVARSLLDRAHDAGAALAARFSGSAGTDSALAQVTTTGGTRGAGIAALAKVAAICVGAAGGAACVATGVVTPPLGIGHDRSEAPVIERALDPEMVASWKDETGVDYESAPQPGVDSIPAPDQPDPAPSTAAAEPASVATGDTVGYPEPAPEPEPVATAGPSGETSSTGSSAGSPAGEFGP